MHADKRIDEQGREILDDTPIVLRVRGQVINQFDSIKAYIRRELSEASNRAGAETFEEANDFDIPEDDIRHSPHEYTEEQEERDREIIADRQSTLADRQARALKTQLRELEARRNSGSRAEPATKPPKRGKVPRQQFLQAEDDDTGEAP